MSFCVSVIPYKADTVSLNGVSFTPREQDVLASMLSGRSFKAIAGLLNLSPKTIETHTRNIFQKMQINSREEAINQIEASTEYETLKQHYFRIILKSDFEKCCESLKGRYKGLSIGLLGDGPLYNQIKKDLEALGISITKAPFIKVDGETVSLNGDTSTPKQKAYEVCFLELLKEIAKNAEATAIINTFLAKHQDIKPTLKKTPLLKKPMKRIYLYGILALLVIGIISTCSLYYGKREVLSNLYLQPKNKLLIRENDLNALDTMFKRHDDPDQNPVVAITGIGGSGKTTLARLYGKMNAKTLVWEINAQSKESLERSFESFASTIGDLNQKNQREYDLISNRFTGQERFFKLMNFVKKYLRKHSGWIVIYDDLKIDYSDLTPYLLTDQDMCGEGKLLITTRDSNIQFSIDYKQVLDMKPLTAIEKKELFEKIVHKNNKADAGTFLEKIPPFPLDVSVASHYMRDRAFTPEDYIKRLGSIPQTFAQGPYHDTRDHIIAIAIQDIINQHPKFKELLFLLSVIHHADIPLEFLEEHYGNDVIDLFLHVLKKHSFVINISSKNEVRVFSIHESVHDALFAYLGKGLDEREKSCFVRNFFNFLYQNLKDTIMIPRTPYPLKALINHAQIFLSCKNLLDDKERIMAVGVIGNACSALGLFSLAESILLEGLEEKGLQQWPNEAADLYRYLGVLYALFGKHLQAMPFLTKSIELLEKDRIKNQKTICKVLTHKGAVFRQEGNYKMAIQCVQEASSLCKEKTDFDIAWLSGYLGFFYNENGNYDDAKKFLLVAKEIFERSNNIMGKAWVKLHLGYNLLFTGLHKEAEKILQESYNGYHKAFDKNFVNLGWVQGLMGLNYGFLGNFKKARFYLNEGYRVFKEHFGAEHTETARHMQYMGIVSFLEGNYNNAERFLNKSLEIFKDHPQGARSREYLAKIQEKRKA